MAESQARQLVMCVNNEGYPASLERRKIYVALRDADAEKHGLVRIVDESGDDYLYPKAFVSPDRAAPECQESGLGRRTGLHELTGRAEARPMMNSATCETSIPPEQEIPDSGSSPSAHKGATRGRHPGYLLVGNEV
jgi:hypothetical protein